MSPRRSGGQTRGSAGAQGTTPEEGVRPAVQEVVADKLGSDTTTENTTQIFRLQLRPRADAIFLRALGPKALSGTLTRNHKRNS